MTKATHSAIEHFFISFLCKACAVYRWPYSTMDSLQEDRWPVSGWSAILFWVGDWTVRILEFITRLEGIVLSLLSLSAFFILYLHCVLTFRFFVVRSFIVERNSVLKRGVYFSLYKVKDDCLTMPSVNQPKTCKHAVGVMKDYLKFLTARNGTHHRQKEIPQANKCWRKLLA